VRSRAVRITLAVLAAVLAAFAWRTLMPSEEGQIRRRLNGFVDDFNEGTTDGLGLVARAAKIGSYFTEDVVVDLGPGTAQINGRETLMGMAARLQPRTAAFTVAIEDLTVTVNDDGTAIASLTGTFRRKSLASGEESIDAREFALVLRKTDGEWRVARVTAVDTLR
jgi:hypothetical protein